MDGEEKSRYVDWKIEKMYGRYMLVLYYPSGKNYKKNLSMCTIEPTFEIDGNIIKENDGHVFKEIVKAVNYANRYLHVQYPDGSEEIFPFNHYTVLESNDFQKKEIFQYLCEVARERCNILTGNNKQIAENVVRQLAKLVPTDLTVLYSYCNKTVKQREPISDYIYPFGINETQMNAVEAAFLSQISVIEGPPGTGKTQTILNIIANILINNKTVAIVSNNNLAVENVYEKLHKNDLDYVVAKLGNKSNRDIFFTSIQDVKEVSQGNVTLEDIKEVHDKIKNYLHSKNELARLISEISEFQIEYDYLKTWYEKHIKVEKYPIEKYKISPEKMTQCIVYLHYLKKQHISFKDKINLLLHYHILKSEFLNNESERQNFIYSLQLAYYEKALFNRNKEKREYEKLLSKNNYDELIENLKHLSMNYLKQYLSKNISENSSFTSVNYDKNFEFFLRRFPVIGSGTHSLINSIGNGAVLDYVILDEASQQDIVPGFLALGCAQNMIIVGDRKQLSHIPIKTNIRCPDVNYNCETKSLLDSVCEIFQNQIPRTLLKEHYRCHPKIIQFCNMQFYNNELIPMKKDKGEDALCLITTAKGNHMRDLANRRELESLDYDEDTNTGFIAPFNKQIDLSKEILPVKFAKNTIHKFQGRECDSIIFSTVLDKKLVSRRKLDFVDNASLVNVAVSRAQKKFTLVTGQDVFTKNNKHIAALIRYIKYYANGNSIIDSPVISAFDLLYDEYDASLERLRKRLYKDQKLQKSERIVATLLNDIIAQDEFHSFKFHMQIRLKQLISTTSFSLTSREEEFINHGASCDFVIYYKVGKTPVAVIEVDGFGHKKETQIERDALKNNILAKANIPLLRLDTDSAFLEKKIRDFIKKCIQL